MATIDKPDLPDEQGLREDQQNLSHVVARFDAEQQQLAERQANLSRLRAPYDAELKRVDKQIKEAVAAKHQTGPTDGLTRTEFKEQLSKPVTKKQVENLLARAAQPQTVPVPPPPTGVVPIPQRDLKSEIEARQKQAKLDRASQNFRQAFQKARGR